jgi:hypothetical protein
MLAAVDSAEHSKEMLWHMPQHFVDMRFLSAQEFCRREYFVNANILSTPIFSVDANISVRANILSPPIFFRRQYFLSVFRIKDDY